MFIDNSNPSPQAKVLFLQEFTGVYCYTCPLAHGITDQIENLYPAQVAAMNVHSHFFSIYDDPNVMGNLYDLRTEDGDTLVSMLGGVYSVPSAAFDMTPQQNEPEIISFDRSMWLDHAADAIAKTPTVNIEMETELNSVSRELKIVAKYHFLQTPSTPLFYSLALVENDIIDKQFVDTVVVDDYHHMHILRDMVTDAKGELLSNGAIKDEVYIKVWSYTIPLDWNEDNVELITYVHEQEQLWDVKQTAIVAIQ
jgi:hypothetical protein